MREMRRCWCWYELPPVTSALNLNDLVGILSASLILAFRTFSCSCVKCDARDEAWTPLYPAPTTTCTCLSLLLMWCLPNMVRQFSSSHFVSTGVHGYSQFYGSFKFLTESVAKAVIQSTASEC